MNKSYSIAYKDKNGLDFHGLPWITGSYDTLEDVTTDAENMRSEGYVDVVPFDATPLLEPNIVYEDISWTFVNQHKI